MFNIFHLLLLPQHHKNFTMDIFLAHVFVKVSKRTRWNEPEKTTEKCRFI